METKSARTVVSDFFASLDAMAALITSERQEEIAYISELRPSISILDRSGTVLARFDSPSGHGLWGDSAGDIYLAEVGGRKLTK